MKVKGNLRKLYPELDLFFKADPKNPVIVYLLHFDKSYHHARHYLGSVKKDRFTVRMEEHRSGGNGSHLMKAVRAAGIGWQIAHVWAASRDFEMWIKEHVKHTARICPVCSGQMVYGDGAPDYSESPF